MKIIKYNKAFEYFCKKEKKKKWAFDNKIIDTKRIDVDWSTLVVWLMGGHLVSDAHKFEQLMLSITKYRAQEEYEDFVYKRADNVISQEALILDYDDGTTIQEFREEWGDYEWVAYTTFSHSDKLTKFRVILPLKNTISNKEIKDRVDGFRDEFISADKTSFDVGRSFFIPSCPSEQQHLAHNYWNEGKLYDWTHIPVVTTPDPVKREIIRTGVSGKDKHGKILYDTLDIVGFFKAIGLYKKSVGGGKHEVGCPWEDAHTSSADTGTAIWEEGTTGTPVYYCVHLSHGKKTLFDVTNWAKDLYGKDFMRQFYEVEQFDDKVDKKLNDIEIAIAELKEKL